MVYLHCHVNLPSTRCALGSLYSSCCNLEHTDSADTKNRSLSDLAAEFLPSVCTYSQSSLLLEPYNSLCLQVTTASALTSVVSAQHSAQR
jgi:hypothetical protein